MSQPGDHSRLGPSLDRYPLRSGHRAAADRGGMLRYGIGKLFGQAGIAGSEVQERQDGPAEVFDIVGLLPVPSGRVCGSPLRVGVGGALRLEVGTDRRDAICRSSDAP